MGVGLWPRRRPVVTAVVGLAETEDLRRTGLLEGMDDVARIFS